MYVITNLCFWWQVWEEMDPGRTDEREADGGSAHWNSMGVCDLHCFGQRQTDFLQYLTRR